MGAIPSHMLEMYSYGNTVGTADACQRAVRARLGSTIPAAGSEVVKVAQRKSSDTAVAMYYLYDASGRLTDVCSRPWTTPGHRTLRWCYERGTTRGDTVIDSL